MRFKVFAAAWMVALLSVPAMAARQLRASAGADGKPVIFDNN
jgi:hypothetical protein